MLTAGQRELAELEALLAASPVGIAILDRDLRYVRVNEAIARINRRPVAEHFGRSVREIVPHVADLLEPMLRRVIDSGQPLLNHEARDPTAAGTMVYILNYFPVLAPGGSVIGVGGIVVDVTESSRATEALRLEQARTQSILDHAPAAIWVKDTEGRLVLANHQLADALFHSDEQVIGRRSTEFLPPDIARQHEEHDRRVIAENRAIEVEESVPSDEGVRTFLTVKFPIPGTPPLIGGIATEITERKVMEEELRVAIRSRDELLAVVSHDLRNPLGAIKLASSALSELGATPEQRRMVDVIVRAGLRMEHLINDLLDSASVRAGRLELDLHHHPLRDLLAEASDLQQSLAQDRSLRLSVRSDVPDLDVRCDRNRILQVFANLISNAVKFCRPGDEITIGAKRRAADVCLWVSDSGPGLTPELVPRVFDPYVSGTDHRAQGAGLGLHIARGIVEGHGGEIWVESEPGTGATFYFTLPAPP